MKVTPAGYFVISTKETIPFSEATPSPTGTYWRCQWGGTRKCFFAPPSEHLSGDRCKLPSQSFACKPRTKADRPVWRSRLSRSAARIARTSAKARSRSRLITT